MINLDSQLVAQTAEPVVNTPADERRKWSRYSMKRPVFCRAGSSLLSSHGWPAKVEDISVGGISLCLNRRFEPETLMIIELPSTAEDSVTTTVVARVLRVTRISADRWSVACAFCSKLDDDELEAQL